MKQFYSCLLLYLLQTTSQVFCQTPDWSNTVASIFYDNCTVCHHDGGIAPFSLIDYATAFENGFQIQADINAKKMPPWPADPDYSHFWNEKVLSDADVTAINDWVNGGMPSGDLNDAPIPPIYNGQATMLDADDTVSLPVYTISSALNDYRSFVVHTNFTETKYINATEFIPGDASTVHHVIFHYDTSDISYQKDLADTLPGYATGDLGGDPSPYAVNWGGWHPGHGIFSLPPNMGFMIPPNSDFVFSIHYAPGNLGKVDSSKLYIKFCTLPDSVIRPIYKSRWLYAHAPVLINGPLEIPANQIKTFNEVSLPTSHKSLIGINPHSHLVCNAWQVRMVGSPEDTTNLIDIPQWYFDWQFTYLFTKVLEVPNNAVMLGKATFDNTSNNPNNPNDPPEDIHEGGSSLQEMMNCGFWLMDYQPGDENIILDSAFYGLPTSQQSISPQLSLNIYPNPSSNLFHIISDLPAHDLNWELTNIFGNVVKSTRSKNVAKGVYTADVDATNLPSGIYYLTIQSGGFVAAKQLVIAK